MSSFPSVEAQSEKAKSSIRDKCEVYLDRAEKIRNHLEKQKKLAATGHNVR